MKTFFIKTLGCKTNQLEGQIIAQNLVDAGFLQVRRICDADFYILNSCTVTKSAETQMNYLLNKAKRENPTIKTVLAGCVVQAGGEIRADIMLDNKQKLQIANILKGVGVVTGKKIANCTNDTPEAVFPFLEKPKSTRVSVKIQEGCNNSCSYCIIPKARGASVSNSIKNTIKQINHVENLGHKEIVLTGIHIGQWGAEWGASLIELLCQIEKTKIHRYRLGSLYINEIDDELIAYLKKSEKFCPHFHLSLQSLCDKTLSAMNRNYTANEALILIEKLHKNFELPFLGSDIIVGFPLENEEDFQTTFDNAKSAKLSKIHVFPYSRRPNTAADKMEGHVKTEVKHARARRLIELSGKLHSDFLEKNLNSELEIIYENRSAKNGLNKGVSRNYIEIYQKSETDLKGSMENIILRKNNLLV